MNVDAMVAAIRECLLGMKVENSDTFRKQDNAEGTTSTSVTNSPGSNSRNLSKEQQQMLRHIVDRMTEKTFKNWSKERESSSQEKDQDQYLRQCMLEVQKESKGRSADEVVTDEELDMARQFIECVKLKENERRSEHENKLVRQVLMCVDLENCQPFFNAWTKLNQEDWRGRHQEEAWSERVNMKEVLDTLHEEKAEIFKEACKKMSWDLVQRCGMVVASMARITWGEWQQNWDVRNTTFKKTQDFVKSISAGDLTTCLETLCSITKQDWCVMQGHPSESGTYNKLLTLVSDPKGFKTLFQRWSWEVFETCQVMVETIDRRDVARIEKTSD